MPTTIYLQPRGKGSGRSSAWPRIKSAKEGKRKKPEERKKKKPKTRPTKLPKRATYPRWWKQVRTAGISFSGAGTYTIIPAEPGTRIFLTTITFTVGGETNITLLNGAFAFSGPMDFGGTNEPRGIVIPMGEAPLMLSASSAFRISSSLAVQVSGFVAYLSEVVEPPPEK